MSRGRGLVAALLLLFGLVGCGGVTSSPESTASGVAGSLVPLASGEPPPWEQPVPAGVEATDWQPVGANDQPIDPGGGPWADPGALLADTQRFFAAQTPGGEVTARLVSHDPEAGTAVGHVRILTAGDDSVAGIDLRLELGEVEGGWRIVSVEERLHCRRGVSGELCA
jgi:hypothetical protein